MRDTRPNTIQYRFFGPVYRSAPATDIFGSVVIAMPQMSAVCALEYFAVTLTNMLTAATRFAGVGWWWVDYLNALTFGFIGDVASQLVETPAIVQSSLRLTEPFVRRFTNAFKLFETNRFLFFFCFGDQCLSNRVICYFGSGSFPTGNTFECFVGTPGSFRLQRSTGFLMDFAKLIKGFSLVGVPVRIGGNVSNAQVNAQHVLTQLFRPAIRHFAGSVQVKFAPNVAKVGFPLLVLQQLGVMFTRYVVYFLSSFYRPKRNDTPVKSPAKNTGIVANRAILTEIALLLFVKLVSIGDLAHTTYHRLCRKRGRGFDVVVRAVVDFILTEHFVFPRPDRNTVTSSVRFLHGLQQQFSLLWGGSKVDFGGQFHYTNIRKMC